LETLAVQIRVVSYHAQVEIAGLLVAGEDGGVAGVECPPDSRRKVLIEVTDGGDVL